MNHEPLKKGSIMKKKDSIMKKNNPFKSDSKKIIRLSRIVV